MSDHSRIGKDGLVQIDIHILSVTKTGCVLSKRRATHPDQDPFITKHRKGPESGSLSEPLQVTLGLSPQPCLSSAWTLTGVGEGGNRRRGKGCDILGKNKGTMMS